MTARDPLMDPLRVRVNAMIADNALRLGSAPKSGSAPGRGAPEGAYDIALNGPERSLVKGWMRASGADAGFDRTIGRMTGGQFGQPEVRSLEDRALKAAQWSDIAALKGITEGPPVSLSPSQKVVIDRLMGQLGSDDLADRARDAYQGAIRAGQVRVR